MTSVRLEHVSKTYAHVPLLSNMVYNQSLTEAQADQAFAGRVRHQWEAEQAARSAGEGQVRALDDVSIVVPDGQTVSVVGPSGCGKSTLLRVVAGLINDYEGQVFYGDQDMRDVPPKDRYIGMVFQSYALYPHFRGRGNLSFFFAMHKRPDEETNERIRVTSEIMGIGFDELLKRKPGTLSGGQQQRVAIGRAIVRDPHLFLFDEPLSNLDAKLRAETRIQIKRLLRRFGITSLYVTHDQTEAITLGDRVAVMRDGRIEQMGPFQELMAHPVNAFVAGFLGVPPMNMFAGGVVTGDHVDLDACRIPLPPLAQGQVQEGQQVTVGVRPDAAHLVLGDAPVLAGARLHGTVENVEPDFARRVQIAHLRSGPLFYAAQGPLEPTLNVGDEVTVALPAERLYFFDAETEQRIGHA